MTIKEGAGYEYALKMFSKNSITDLKQALLSFRTCKRWAMNTEWNRGLKAGIKHLIKTKNESSKG